MVLILLGPPGVGKGTQSELLSRELGFRKIATGDLLREARDDDTPLGRKAQGYMDAGELVPDDLIIALVEEKLAGLAPDSPVLFDGFPRTVGQAEALDGALRDAGREVDRVVVLEAPEEVVVRRISGRRIGAAGRVYNVYDDPPRVNGVCDETGKPLIHRKDDQPDTVRRRLQVYVAQTEPIVDYYERSEPSVVRVDGTGGIEATHDDVRAALRGPRPD